MKILAIESSCDETSATVIENSIVLSNIISSQAIHSEFGGIVPELASRAHLSYISEVVSSALQKADINIEQIEALAVTSEPGLIGSLIVGSNFTKGLSIKYGLPIIPVNHIEGHIYSGSLQNPDLKFPYITLVVSGGHTSLFYVESFNKYTIIGSTLDDAAGEAFDKIAVQFGLSYPGGPEIEKYSADGNIKAYDFPRSMLNSGDYNFSFSGLKTSVRYFLARQFPSGVPNETLPDLCASVQEAIVEVLVDKTIRAAREYKVHDIVIAGGVSANIRLRTLMAESAKLHGLSVIAPQLDYCMDNAAMIGFIAEKKITETGKDSFMNLEFTVHANSIRAPRKKKNVVNSEC